MSNTMTWENSQPPPKPTAMTDTDRLIGIGVVLFVIIFLTILGAGMFMNGSNPGWGWVLFGLALVRWFRSLLLQ